jgi:RNA polymerase sigma-70 factor (ECF subfamily)
VRRHYPAIRQFFFTKIHDEIEREDLIQETLQALTTAITNYEGRSSFKGFLFGIARHKLYGHIRTRYHNNRAVDPLTESVEDLVGTSPASYASLQEQIQQLVLAMARLPIDDQILLELRYWQDMTGPELGELFGLSPEGARGRLLRARQTLARLLAQRGEPLAAEELQVQAELLELRLQELGLAVG